MKTQLNSIEAAALAAFEKAHENYKRSAIGHTRRYNQACCLAAAFDKLVSLNLESALTWQERADARWAKHTAALPMQ